jgi:small subunit ribosomal protein S8
MSMTDPIADMLTRVRNALMVRHASTDVPASRIKKGLARILEEEGFIEGFEEIQDRKQGVLRIKLKYGPAGEAVISGIERVSRPGRRVYCGADEIGHVLGGLGISILSTPAGVLSGREARARRVGGEILARVW